MDILPEMWKHRRGKDIVPNGIRPDPEDVLDAAGSRGMGVQTVREGTILHPGKVIFQSYRERRNGLERIP